MKITFEGELTGVLKDLIDMEIITLEELNASVKELNEEKAKTHYSIWSFDGEGIYHCLRCEAAVFRDNPDELADTCPCCGAYMIRPKCRCDDKRGGKR